MFWMFYLSGQKHEPTKEQMTALGLEDTLYGYPEPKYPRPGLSTRWVSDGPDREGGLICTPTKDLNNKYADVEADPSYLPDIQEWRQCDGYWFGWYRHKRPMPHDLVREDTVIGYNLLLGDGNRWMVPVASSPVESGGVWEDAGEYSGSLRRDLDRVDDGFLPQVLGIDSKGNWETAIDPKFIPLRERASVLYDAFYNESEIGLTDDVQREWACDILKVNYKVNKFVIGNLGLFKEETPSLILGAFIDMLSVLREREARVLGLKKKESTTAGDTSSSGNGTSLDSAKAAIPQPMQIPSG